MRTSGACVTQSLYMDGVQLLPERLQEFVDVMTEKELRLRLPLEELDILLEEWMQTQHILYIRANAWFSHWTTVF